MIVLTAAAMRSVDRATIDGGHASGPELMERAGRGVVEALERRFGGALAMRALVLCGGGNNGGDGFVAARHLGAGGAHVRVGLLVPREKVRGDARHHLDAMETAGVPVECVADADALRALVGERAWDFALDALLGTGAEGEPHGLLAVGCETLNALAARGTRVVAVDLPTGVDADSGACAPAAVRAALTVTFGALKRAHVLWPGHGACGTIDVVDIGLVDPRSIGGPDVRASERAELGALVPRRDPRAHKGTTGRVLVAGGSAGAIGAVALAARAATRAGAGYVRAMVPSSLADVLAGQLVEQMVLAAGEDPLRSLSSSALETLLAEAGAADAVGLGPGLSRREGSAALARALYARVAKPMVLDADGLNAFAGRAGELARAAGPRVLTPHLGELSRLTGETAEALEARRIDAALEWSARFGAVLVVKGAPTVTAAPDGRAEINLSGNPGMATAGMGDVLTGAVAALLAQGLAPFDAARLAVHAHGLAGDLAAAERGPIGLAAGDLVGRLPSALAQLAAAAHA